MLTCWFMHCIFVNVHFFTHCSGVVSEPEKPQHSQVYSPEPSRYSPRLWVSRGERLLSILAAISLDCECFCAHSVWQFQFCRLLWKTPPWYNHYGWLLCDLRLWMFYTCRYCFFVIHVWHQHFLLNEIKKYLTWLGVYDQLSMCVSTRNVKDVSL